MNYENDRLIFFRFSKSKQQYLTVIKVEIRQEAIIVNGKIML